MIQDNPEGRWARGKKEDLPNLEKAMPIQVQEASRTPNRLDQNRTTP
jgi:hypothetical protein